MKTFLSIVDISEPTKKGNIVVKVNREVKPSWIERCKGQQTITTTNHFVTKRGYTWYNYTNRKRVSDDLETVLETLYRKTDFTKKEKFIGDEYDRWDDEPSLDREW